ncbi:hypothetical protein HanRHA438_Chr14g0650231 [Helianthus annuus]|nr:hypothetical protein HanRHA438_Chr14g0650231 [Helianthus annuus]
MTQNNPKNPNEFVLPGLVLGLVASCNGCGLMVCLITNLSMGYWASYFKPTY